MSIVYDYAAINKAGKAISPRMFDVGKKEEGPLTMCLYYSGKCARSYCEHGVRCEYNDKQKKKIK